MNFYSYLPDKSFYKPLPVAHDKDYFLFQDISTSAIKIKSPISNPFNQRWGIALQHQKQKSAAGQYPYRLIIKLVTPSTDAIPCELIRKLDKGVYTYGKDSPLVFIAAPILLDTGMFRFVTYSLYSKV